MSLPENVTEMPTALERRRWARVVSEEVPGAPEIPHGGGDPVAWHEYVHDWLQTNHPSEPGVSSLPTQITPGMPGYLSALNTIHTWRNNVGVGEPPEVGDHFLYSEDDVQELSNRMSGTGPYYSAGDAGHGGSNSPGDGARLVTSATKFLNGGALPYVGHPITLPWRHNDNSAPGYSGPSGEQTDWASPLHAAFCVMTQAAAFTQGQRDDMAGRLKDWLLYHANHADWEWNNWDKYGRHETDSGDWWVGWAAPPIMQWAAWMTRVFKTRDMLGRDAFSASENDHFDTWMYWYANVWLHWIHQHYSKSLTAGRLDRNWSPGGAWSNTPTRKVYDGREDGVPAQADNAYMNRNCGVVSSAIYIANYLKHYGFTGPTWGATPWYGALTIDQMLHHGMIHAEEMLMFGVWPHGYSMDFERGSNSQPAEGWRYAGNTMAQFFHHVEAFAKRGNFDLLSYGTTDGYAESDGSPATVVGSAASEFPEKTAEFVAWFMARYVNDAWGRRYNGSAMTPSNRYRDIQFMALAGRLFPHNTVIRDCWRREVGMPSYTSSVESQGRWSGWYGEAGTSLGLIEHGGLDPIGGS